MTDTATLNRPAPEAAKAPVTGPANDFEDNGPVSKWRRYDPEEREDFYEGVRTHGNEPTRHKAIRLAEQRVLADTGLRASTKLVFVVIASACRQQRRYSTMTPKELAQ